MANPQNPEPWETVRRTEISDIRLDAAGVVRGVDAPFKDEIDLRMEVSADIILNRGHWCLLRRGAGDCGACGTDPQPRCPYCNGLGKLYEDHEIRARKELVLKERTDLGIQIPQWVFYLTWDTAPTPGDIILEIRLDEHGEIMMPHKIEYVYDIATVQDWRDQGGRIEYWECATELRTTGK